MAEQRGVTRAAEAIGSSQPAMSAALSLLRTVSRPRQAAADALESGTPDLAVGYFPDLHKAGIYRQELFDNPRICPLRRGHPSAKCLTLKAFFAADHAVVPAPVIAGHQSWHERFLKDPANLWLRQLVRDPFKSARRHAAAAPAASTR